MKRTYLINQANPVLPGSTTPVIFLYTKAQWDAQQTKIDHKTQDYKDDHGGNPPSEGDGDVAIDWHKIGDAYVIGVPRSLVDDSPVLLLQHPNQFVPAGCTLPPMSVGFSGSSPTPSIL